jgi:hypothetical protein
MQLIILEIGNTIYWVIEAYYPEWGDLFIVMLNVIMLSVIMLNVVALPKV